MARDKYIQFRVSSEQKANIQANAARSNQTVTDYIMAAIMEYERINLGRYGQPYGYGCPYQFARDYLVQYGIRLEEEGDGSRCNNNNYARQVIKLAIEVLEDRIQELKAVKSVR